MMGWMAPLRHLGAKVLVGENQSADKEPSMNENSRRWGRAVATFQMHQSLRSSGRRFAAIAWNAPSISASKVLSSHAEGTRHFIDFF